MITRRALIGAAAATIFSPELHADEPKSGNTVFLTSDDGPDAGTTTIMDIAERLRVPITLFMIGMNVASSSEHRLLLDRARESEWVTVGNHSYSHALGRYAQSYHDAKWIVADFQRANVELGFTSCPVTSRGPGRNVWRLPGMRIDDPGISYREMGIEDGADDDLFVNGFYLYGWDFEWLHDARGIPVHTSATVIGSIADVSRSHRPGKIVMLMHDVMMRTAKGADELTKIIEGVRERGLKFGRLSEYVGPLSETLSLELPLTNRR
jgi:peptidoglycan/xylan/chitin deacetylase (PgdA/CDA1 family)